MNNTGTLYSIGDMHPLGDSIKEGLSIMYDNDYGFILDFKFSNLENCEIENFRNGILSLDLAYLNKIIFFIIDIEGFTFSDIAFTSNITELTSKDDIKDIKKGEGFCCSMILTEGTNNVIKALRVISLSNHFSNILVDKMREQFDNNFNKNKHTLDCIEIYNKYSSVKQLKKRSIAHMKSTNNNDNTVLI